MEPRDAVILNLVRLGLAGDVPSIQRYARTLMRAPGPETDGKPDAFRRALSRLLSDGTPARSALREAAPVRQATQSSHSTFEEVPSSVPPILPVESKNLLSRVLNEHRERARLADAALEPTRSALFVGPPGVGKTMAARFLAAELGVPLITLDLVSVMSSLLGKSGQNIRDAIELARARECVFLLDEVDAIAKRRDDASDVGELKRIVNLLLLELDRWPATSLLVAATNHPELLDRAVWRRFDLVVEFRLPDAVTRLEILQELLRSQSAPLDAADVNLVVQATEGASGSDLARMVRTAVRVAVLARSGSIRVPLLEEAIGWVLRRAREDTAFRGLYCQLAHQALGQTQRQIAERLDVSHVTVGNLLRSGSSNRKPRVGEGG